LPVLGSRLSADGALAVLSVTLTQLHKIETEYGSAMCRTLLGQLEEAVRKTSATFGNTPILGMCQDESKLALLIFLPGRVSSRCSQTADLSALAGRMEAVLTPELSRLERLIHAPGRVVVGWGEGLYSSRLPIDRLVAEVTVEAAEAASRRLASQQSDDRSLLRMLFVEKQLNFHFQPIVDQNLRRYGFEALVRGPAHLVWKAPDQMFARAAEVGLMDELDRGCCMGAIQEAAGRLGPDERLFLNLLPSTLHDQSFVAEELPAVLSASGISANRVVLEVTEQHAIESLAAFEESIRKVVDQGMSIALDDVGAGNSNLNALLEIRPSYIKLDRQLIQGVAGNGLKRQLISALVAAADSMPAQLIAEGVEQPEDGEELKRLGVNLLQGYLFGRPLPFPERPIA
jgi:EAL domain-containing protein (putative c-di-GMP-specific phosphodiesterase class I)